MWDGFVMVDNLKSLLRFENARMFDCDDMATAIMNTMSVDILKKLVKPRNIDRLFISIYPFLLREVYHKVRCYIYGSV